MSHQTDKEFSSLMSRTLLDWDNNGQPISTQFNDVYFSKASGINEARYVFIDHNNLTERFEALDSPCSAFVIGETGFGTGLNFLCAWQHFEQHAPEHARLHFISTEKYPLDNADLIRALSLWPELSDYRDQLISRYIPNCPGFHVLVFANGRIKLTLIIGDALTTLSTIDTQVNAWFLDGFAPAKNPDIWEPSLLKAMTENSAEGATYATFTAARSVRNGLKNAGFSVTKTKGFGHKRDMICGQLNANQKPRRRNTIWHQYPLHKPSGKSAVVIGGGLSGTSCARSLAERGWQVTLLEQNNQLATEASGNPQGILYAKLSSSQTSLSQLIAQGFCYTANLIRDFEARFPDTRHACGVIQLCTSPSVKKRYLNLAEQFPDTFLQFMNQHQLSEKAGIEIKHDGLFFPEAGWVNPPSICRQLVQHSNITIKTNVTIDELLFDNNQWQLKSKNETVITTSTVVVAEGVSTHRTKLLSHLPLKGIRGQITKVTATEQSRKLKACVCGEGYVAPAMNGYHTIGATFDFKSTSTKVVEADHHRNLIMQSDWFPAFSDAIGHEHCHIEGGKAGFRCTTPDYLPVVGPVVNKARFIEQFAMLRKNVKHSFQEQPEYWPGLYVTAGHGSRGLITCPISGELLASIICDDPSPVAQGIKKQLNPARFLIRDLARSKI